MRYKEFYSTKKQGVAEDLEQKFKFYYSVFTHDEMQDFKERDQLDASGSPLVDMDEDEITISASSVSEAYQKLLQHFPNQAVFVHSSTPIEQGVAEGSLNEFAIDNDGRNDGGKFISWKKFIEQLKQILAKDFDVNENIIKDTIKANFIPHDPMEFGPTVLYSYYDRRPGRNSGAFSTRGAIQVGKYFPGLRTGENKLLTAFNILKGHPFERQFDLTFDNIYKIANIIKGNTKGAYQMQSQGVAEATGDEKFDTMMSTITASKAVKAQSREDKVNELIRQYFWHKRRADLGSAKTDEYGHDKLVKKILNQLNKMGVDLSTFDPVKLRNIKSQVYEQGVAEGRVVNPDFSKRFKPSLGGTVTKSPYYKNPDINIPAFDKRRNSVWRDGTSNPKDREEFHHFEVDSTGRSYQITGITSSGAKVQVSTTPSKELAEVLVNSYNRGGFTDVDIERVPLPKKAKKKPNLNLVKTSDNISETSAGSVATVVNPKPKDRSKVGTLFGGTYKQRPQKDK